MPCPLLVPWGAVYLLVAAPGILLSPSREADLHRWLQGLCLSSGFQIGFVQGSHWQEPEKRGPERLGFSPVPFLLHTTAHSSLLEAQIVQHLLGYPAPHFLLAVLELEEIKAPCISGLSALSLGCFPQVLEEGSEVHRGKE